MNWSKFQAAVEVVLALYARQDYLDREDTPRCAADLFGHVLIGPDVRRVGIVASVVRDAIKAHLAIDGGKP